MRRQLLAMLVFVPAVVILAVFFYTVLMAPPSAMRWLFFLIHLCLLSACLWFAVQVWLGKAPAFGWRTYGVAVLDALLFVMLAAAMNARDSSRLRSLGRGGPPVRAAVR